MKHASLNARLQHLAREYVEALKETLGDRLVSVVLFGSVARSEAGPTSDIDLFVVLEEAPAGMRRRRALLEPARERLPPRWKPCGSRASTPILWKSSAAVRRPDVSTPFTWI